MKYLLIVLMFLGCGSTKNKRKTPKSTIDPIVDMQLKDRLAEIDLFRIFCGTTPCLKQGDELDDGDSALWMGILSLAGERYDPSSIQDSTGRLWRSPGQMATQTTHSKNSFSRDMFLGYLAMQAAAEATDLASLDLLVEYLRDNEYIACPENINGTCNVHYLQHRTFWAVIGYLYEREGEPAPIESIQAYAGDQSQIGLEAKAARTNYELHLVSIMIMVYTHLGANDEAVDNQRKLIAQRDPGNPFYQYLHLGKHKYVANDVLIKCVPNRISTDYAWRRNSSEKAWERDAGHGCYVLLKLLTKEK